MFYNRLSGGTRSSIDAIAGGLLMGKTEEAVFQLLEEMVANNYQWLTKILGGHKSQSVHDIDALFVVYVKLDTLVRRFTRWGCKVVF